MVQRVASLAIAGVLFVGCSPGRVVPWDIDFGDPEIAMRTRSLRVTIQRGSCARRSTVEFAHEYPRDDPARPETKPLADGSYAFSVQAVDADCAIVAESCQTVEITAEAPPRVTTVLDQLADPPVPCDACMRCTAARDAGSGPVPDASAVDGGPSDAGPDAAVPDDAGTEEDAGNGVDAGPVPHVECDGTCNCEALGYRGTCTDTTSIWWDMDRCWVRDCGAEGSTCGFISPELGYGCMPVGDGSTTQRCSALGSEGHCFEDGTLVWFDGSTAQCKWRDCPAMGRVCGYGGPSIGFNCLP